MSFKRGIHCIVLIVFNVLLCCNFDLSLSSPTVASTLHHLSAVYRSQGKTEEAETLENYAQKSKQKVNNYMITSQA